jgi:peptide/nickel transport system permease protein
MTAIQGTSEAATLATRAFGDLRQKLLSGTAKLPWAARAGVFVFIVICLLLAAAPWISPDNPNVMNLNDRLAGPSLSHLLGTDAYGRDVLSRLLAGGRFSVTIAGITVVLSSVFGTLVGIIAGRIGGLVDEIIMRTADVLLAFPDMLLALVLILIMGPGPRTVVVAMSVVGWTAFARLARALTLEINTRGYIEAAKALGCSQRFIVLRHVLPNARNPVLSLALSRFAYQLITLGSLSYLGLGVQPPQSDWGSMLADGQPYMQTDPWLVIFPGLAIFITALSLTVAGQGIGHERAAKEPAEIAKAGV